MDSNHLPVSGGLAVVIAVIISYFVINPAALEGIRPAGDSREVSQGYGIEDVQARLWQDPFATVADYQRKKQEKQPPLYGRMEIQVVGKDQPASFDMALKPAETGKAEKEEDPHSFKALIHKIYAESTESKTGVDLLTVMISAGPYPEQVEARLRERYAVIAGLAASGYQPEDENHIGYVDLGGDSQCGEKYGGTREFGAGKMPGTVPFEWFKKKAGKEEKYTLLLWLDEDAFRSNSLCKLNFLLKDKIREPLHEMRKSEVTDKAKKTLRELEKKSGKPVTKEEIRQALNDAVKDTPAARLGRVSIIGPRGSGTLKAMLSELDSKDEFAGLRGVFFYSATATAEAAQLLGPEDIRASEGGDPVARKFLSKHLILFRTIADDRMLTDKLVAEIRRRLFDWRKRKEEENFQVALVSEWDTLYGRSLPKAFIASASKSFGVEKSNREEWARNHIHRFSYLRGIDGHIQGQSSVKEGAGEKGNSGNAKETNQHIERPEGRSQKDYLRRLASDMALTHQKLKNEGKKGIRAIGVLGSDVYDKLLVLRALRKQFPKAIFFTTDLDAALLQPDQFPWTRNMLVASSYDLKIASYSDILRMSKNAQAANKKEYLKMMLKATERSIPQNRDAYQTSVFLSTIWATNPTLYKNLNQQVQKELKDYKSKIESKIRTVIKGIVDKKTSREGFIVALLKGKAEVKAAAKSEAKRTEESIKSMIQNGFYQGFGQYIDPRVYEIGRYGAVDLSASQTMDGSKVINPFYPIPIPPVSPRSMMMISCSAVLFGLLIFLFWRRWIIKHNGKDSDDFRKTRQWAEWTSIGVAVFSIVVFMSCYWLSCSIDVLTVWIFLLYFLNVSTWLWMARRVNLAKARAEGEAEVASGGRP